MKKTDKIDIQVLSGEIVRLCLDTPKLFDACSLVESKVKEYTNQELKSQQDECDAWISVEVEPKMSGEYNVLYDLEDGEPELVVTTMDYSTVDKVWRDTRSIGDICNTVKMYKSLPKAPIQTI